MDAGRPAQQPRPLRVLDFSRIWSGPTASLILGDAGCDVVRVESANRLDLTRTVGPFADGVPGIERSGYFDTLNRGKRSVALDIWNEDDRRVALQLAARADVVVENFAPGVMEALGLGYVALRERNPALILLSIRGYGSSGPQADHVAVAPVIEASSGLASLLRYGPDERPELLGGALADHVAGMMGALAVFAAVHARLRDGRGAHVEISMQEALIACLPDAILATQAGMDAASGNDDPCAHAVPQGCYPCRGEDAWVALSVEDDAAWGRLCALLAADGQPMPLPAAATMGERWQARQAIDAHLAEWTRRYATDEALARLRSAAIPSTAVRSASDLRADACLAERGFWAHVETTEAGRRTVPGPLVRLASPAVRPRHGGPRLGAHTEAVLAEWLA